MFSMMIVDDEPIIRQGIKTSINWSSYGINIIAEAGDGQDAFEKILEYSPDIVITDIRMPNLGGLELAEKVKNNNLATRIIILSGYDDFQYAQKSISLNVADYLLKPFGAEELINVVLRIKDKITAEEEKRKTVLYNKILMQENMELIQARFIQDLITKKYTDYSPLLNKAETININLEGPFYQILLVNIDDFHLISENISSSERDFLITSIINLGSNTLNEYYTGIICRSNSDYLILYINLPDNTSNTAKLSKDIQEIVHEKLNLSLTIGIGEICTNLSSLTNSYKGALLALRKKVYQGKGSIIEYTRLKDHEKNKTVFYPDNKEKEFLNELRFLNKDKVMDLLEHLFGKFSAENAEYSNIKNISLRLVLMAQGLLEEMGIDIEQELEISFKPYNEIEKYETIEDIKLWLINLFSTFIAIIKDNKSRKYNKIINNALQYIKENYKKDISLNDIANLVYVTPNYFSRIFKEEMGENFTTWINKYRIEQAKNIIKSNRHIKCYQVSDMAGFNDYKYFSTIFKKFTNMTPSQYKSQL